MRAPQHRKGWCALCRKRCGLAPSHRDTLHAVRMFAHNLAIGGALCAAFKLGRAWQAERMTADWNGGGWTYPFEPGCGRAVDGWGGR